MALGRFQKIEFQTHMGLLTVLKFTLASGEIPVLCYIGLSMWLITTWQLHSSECMRETHTLRRKRIHPPLKRKRLHKDINTRRQRVLGTILETGFHISIPLLLSPEWLSMVCTCHISFIHFYTSNLVCLQFLITQRRFWWIVM